MYYFIGIKGAGMASLATILDDLGFPVMGADIDKHIFTEDELRRRKIPILSFSKENIKDDMIVIIGNAFSDDFEEVQAAYQNPTVKAYRYHTFLGEFMKKYQSFAVAGSHGKTTTTAMLASMLSYSTPTGFLIGDGTGDIHEGDINFVIEACEYRRHFLAYHPDYAIITNADLDHTDYFKDEADYYLAYEEFSKQVKKCSILFGDDPQVRGLTITGNKLYYGEEEQNDVRAINIIETPEYMEFDVTYHGEMFGHFKLPFVGRFLLWNSLSVISVGILLDMTAKTIEDGLHAYHGAKRRFVVEQFGDNVFIDDYAHHPTEVSVTIDAARTRFPDRKLIAIFKPHRVSRVFHFGDEFAAALKKADVVCLCPFTSIDDQEEGIDIDISYLQAKIPGSVIVDENLSDAEYLASLEPAVYLFMSSKDIYGLAEMVKEIQKKK